MNISKDSHSSRGKELDEEHLVAELGRALRETLFTSSLRISPRRVNQMAGEIAASFFQFLEREAREATSAYGRDLAQEGLGHPAILALTAALRRACWESANPGVGLLPAAERYTGALLQGYMEEREASLLQEQQRTIRALQRAQDRTA